MREVKIGNIYRHFKGHLYQVIDICYDANSEGNDLKKKVIYEDINNKDLKWVRDYDEFNSLVDKEKYPNVKSIYRFEEVDDNLLEVTRNMKITNLSEYASKYEDGIRLKKEDDDLRPSYYRDIDRILYSLAYTRYLDKTQVFTHSENDHLSRRMTHVQYVSKIGRTIGRALNLNEDLIEAASLGHDLGHTPFGHVGESILNKISLENNEGFFNHNIQSVRLLMELENYGNGYNLTLQVLDAIMCHNGEFALQEYHKNEKDFTKFLEEYHASFKDKNVLKNLKPMTLEGAVVRISDMIAYLGKDIEDAVRLNIIKYTDIPSNVKKVLGVSNREIVNKIILDIINNSLHKDYIKLSEEVFKCIIELKKFNYENIYYKAYSKEELIHIEDIFRSLFQKYLEDLKNNNEESIIIKNYLSKMSNEYKNNNSKERIVIDYLAGMTDEYIIKQYNLLS